MKTPLLFAALALGAASASAGVPQAVDPVVIPAYRLIRPGLAAAGQPTPEALKGLGEMGFRTVVNLRSEKEGPADERGKGKSLEEAEAAGRAAGLHSPQMEAAVRRVLRVPTPATAPPAPAPPPVNP